MGMEWVTNWMLWFWTAIILFIFFLIETILLIIIKMKTHAMIEFKAWRKGWPICEFYQDSGYVTWKACKEEAGMIEDKDFGTYIINERGSYVDKNTKNVHLPFDAAVATSVNVSAAKLADELKVVIKDDKQMSLLREGILTGKIEESTTVDVLKSSVQFSSIRGMMNAIIPHNITAKIEKMIAARMKGFGKINMPQIILTFCAILGAIILGVIIIKFTLGNAPAQGLGQPIADSVKNMAANAPPLTIPSGTVAG